RPSAPGTYPVLMTVGPYGKDIHFSDFNPTVYAGIAEHGPHLNWETPNPDWWVAQGYVVIRVDQRGIGASPGHLDLFSRQQGEDFYDAIEWAAVQPWSNGKVGLNGVSYYAISQWQVAALQPPHLAAILPWEGMVDLYRDGARNGGIFNDGFFVSWFQRYVLSIQHGYDGSLSEEERAAHRAELIPELRAHTLDDDYYQSRLPDLRQITVPVLSVGNWGTMGLHLRGDTEGYLGVSSPHKWLSMWVGSHFAPFYSEEGRTLQKRFFDYWLKGVETGWLAQPPVQLAIRKGSEVVWRDEQEWPLARTQWTPFYLNAANTSISTEQPHEETQANYSAPEGDVTFMTAPFPQETEVTGPLALTLWVSTTTNDMDLFVTLHNVDANGNEVFGIGTFNEPVPVTAGWLRTSQRKLDASRSTDARPFHSHDEVQLLSPGQIVSVAIEIWPTSMVFAAGRRLAVTIGAHDSRGWANFIHDDPEDRHLTAQPGIHTIYTGDTYPSHLLLPIIPIQ
ncbi:MAG: CocE/NonD family hydrolase, partial [Ktedonobacteraceae bacterium]|nr:CocE/NonD family hydrolase [Ktedonobacteraceae bacterium]